MYIIVPPPLTGSQAGSPESPIEQALAYKPAEKASDYHLEGLDPLTDVLQMENIILALHAGGIKQE